MTRQPQLSAKRRIKIEREFIGREAIGLMRRDHGPNACYLFQRDINHLHQASDIVAIHKLCLYK